MASPYRPRPISGYPEWTPAIRLQELRWLDHIRHCFESYGFCSVETPSVEELEVLLAKGETDKEIYTINRLQADAGQSEARLGLHYDLTVPLARYVAQHFNELTFPFKRYQMQRSWRGERPQEGRFREFTQCDIDVIGVDQLPLHFDAEMPLIMAELLMGLKVPPVRLHISNRKILAGFLAGLGISDPAAAIRVLDKMDKIGASKVGELLVSECGFSQSDAAKALQLAAIKTSDASFAKELRALGVSHELLALGIEELLFVQSYLQSLPEAMAVIDLGIARGFDYYTGTVYEGRLVDYPDFGSVVAGGRYDDLASSFIAKKLPGVGISLGLTRLFSKMVKENLLPQGASSPADILLILPNEEQRPACVTYAQQLRQRGFKVEMYHAPQKLAKQLSYAEKKGIPYVWFPPFEAGGAHEVKNMQQGSQQPADPADWLPANSVPANRVSA